MLQWGTLPSFSVDGEFDSTVREIFIILSRICVDVLLAIAKFLRIDPQFLLDLTDLDMLSTFYRILKSEIHSDCKNFAKCSSSKAHSTEWIKANESSHSFAFSSTLLRICKYSYQQENCTKSDSSDRSVAFGAHTDSSLITVALLSSVPGLEIMDQRTEQWICPEV